MQDDILIIGAGKAGASAALALRQSGYTGAVTLLGAEPRRNRDPGARHTRPLLGRARARGVAWQCWAEA